MMGRSHALTGTLAYQVVALYQPQPIWQMVLGTAVCTGAALFPDIDHPNSTLTATYGPVTRVLSWLIRKLSGGHRKGTHSLVGIGLLGLAAHACVTYLGTIGGRIGLTVLLTLALAGVVRLFHIDGYLDDLAPIPVALALVWLQPVSLTFVPVALVIGALAHMVGDMLTKMPVYITWPFSDKGIALDLFTTGKRVERWIVVPLVCLAIVGTVGMRFAS